MNFPGDRIALAGGPITRPVSIRPNVEAFTSQLSDWFRWDAQSPERIFSAMRSSRVSASGMRSSASARHMRAMPSELDSPNSSRKDSIMPFLRAPARAIWTISWPIRTASLRWPSVTGGRSRRFETTSSSLKCLKSSIAFQSSEDWGMYVAPDCLFHDTSCPEPLPLQGWF